MWGNTHNTLTSIRVLQLQAKIFKWTGSQSKTYKNFASFYTLIRWRRVTPKTDEEFDRLVRYKIKLIIIIIIIIVLHALYAKAKQNAHFAVAVLSWNILNVNLLITDENTFFLTQ